MKSLQELAKNPFIAALLRASRANIIFFGDDTIGRFEADEHVVVYQESLDAFKENFANYKTGVTDAQTGERQVATETVDETQQLFLNTGRQLHSAVQDKFGYKAPQLMAFFPQGLTALNNAKRGDVDTILSGWLKVLPKHPYIGKLGQEWVTKITGLQTNWRNVLAEQSSEKKDVGDGSADADSFLLPMAQNLWDLLVLVIQKNQPNAENVVGNFFDTTPLNRKDNHDNDGLGRTLGMVKDGAGVGLPNVEVTAKNADQQIAWMGKTDGEGKWRTKNISVGMYHFTFEKPGLATQTLSHEVLDDRDTDLDVVMVPA